MKALLFAIVFSLSLVIVHADVVYKIYPFSEKIEVDGKANEKIWKQLPFSDYFVPLKGDGKLKGLTRFKAFSDKEFLYILLEIKDQKLSELNNMPPSKDKPKLSRDNISFYFAPRPEIDDYYKITVDYTGFIEDCFIPTKAGHGYPYSPVVDNNWKSKIIFATNTQNETIYMELQIPVEPLSLQNNLFNRFGFNCLRDAFYIDGKKTIHEVSSWSNVNGEIWSTQKFGLLQGPLYQEPKDFSDTDLQNLDQMTNGMTALLKSLDIYYKAVIKYKFHIPEGTEVNGDISNFDHVPLPQYTVKADGYYRFYNAFRYAPYKELGNHIINKLFQAYTETKTTDGQNYLLWNNLISSDGIIHGYDHGLKMADFYSSKVPYNQSSNKFHLKDVMFIDAFGQGFLDLSEIKDTLDPEIQKKIIVMLDGTLQFLHKPYMLVNSDTTKLGHKYQYFWRIDAINPSKPEAYVGEIKSTDWPFLGQDIILMIMALYNFNSEIANPYIESLLKFSKFYMQYRLSISLEKNPHSPHNIYKLDHRMLSLAEFAKKYQLTQFDDLDQWLKIELPKVYENIPKIEYSENGATTQSWSTQGVLEIYRLLGLKKQYLRFWELSFDESLKPLGLFQGHRILPMNFSSYPIYFDYAKKANDDGILNEKQTSVIFKKIFLLYGNPKLHRDNLKYSLDLLDSQKTRPKWGNTPYQEYIEGVLPEGIYDNGSAQAFYEAFGNYSTNVFFKTIPEHLQYEYTNRYWQYTAPFQYHSDRFSYGKAESYCLLNMVNDKITTKLSEQNEQNFITEVKTPELSMDFPVFGHLDISNLLYISNSCNTPTGFEVVSVLCNETELPFRVYQILSFDQMCVSQEDRAKLVFGIWNKGASQNIKVTIKIKKKNIKQFFGATTTK